jgi:hypothetical protein
MATVSPQPMQAPREEPLWVRRVLVPEMWAALAIAAMWLAVLFTAVFAPDFVSTSGGGTTTTRIPSGIPVALFAYLGTVAVAKRAFARQRGDPR